MLRVVGEGKSRFQEGMHFFLKWKNTRFSSAHFKTYSMTWSDLQYYLFVFESLDAPCLTVLIVYKKYCTRYSVQSEHFKIAVVARSFTLNNPSIYDQPVVIIPLRNELMIVRYNNRPLIDDMRFLASSGP